MPSRTDHSFLKTGEKASETTAHVNQRVLLASVQSTWKDDADVQHTTDLFGELETIVDRYLTEVEAGAYNLPAGQGLAGIGEGSTRLSKGDEYE